MDYTGKKLEKDVIMGGRLSLVAQAYNLSYFWRQRSGGSQVETQAKKSL
jgi:hypothetical protein